MNNAHRSQDIKQMLDIRMLEDELGRRRFRDYVRFAWPIIEPARPFIPSFHIDAIADHLQAVTEGQINKLLVTIAPGTSKSTLTSVLWPSWEWLINGNLQGIYTSYDSDLAIRDSVKCRHVLSSTWYQETFRPNWEFASDQNEKNWFKNSQQGFRIALGVNKGTGYRGDRVVCDDPTNALEQNNDRALAEVIFWWDQVMSTRLNDPSTGAFVIIMQRLSERDLAAHALAQGGYEHLNLPSEFEPARRARTSLITATGERWCDPRTEEGELLFPGLFPAPVIADAKTILGPQGFAAQHQQQPAPSEGGVFKRASWRFWQPKNARLPAIRFRDGAGNEVDSVVVTVPDYMDEMVQSWDCAFKRTLTSDFVAGEVWGRVNNDAYLLDQTHVQADFPETLELIRATSIKWRGAEGKLIEDSANGTAVIQSLRHELTGIIPIQPLGGKESRANAVAAMIRSGNVYLPHPAFAPWVLDFIEECAAFPNGRHDDWVDAMTQALNQLNKSPRVLVSDEPADDDDYGEDDDDSYHAKSIREMQLLCCSY